MLIGVSSLVPRVGKSTVADYLKTKHGFLCGELSEPVIVLAEKFFGYNGNKLDPDQRKILQEVGLMGKTIDPTIWFYQTLNLLRRRVWGMQISISPTFLFHYNLVSTRDEINKDGISDFFNGESVVLSGIRSPLEADEIKKLGGKIMLISNPRIPVDANVHPVENQLYNYDFDINIINESTIEKLYETVDNMLQIWKKE